MPKRRTKKKSIVDFDELNSLEEYFAPMQIQDGDKAARIQLANLLTDAFLFVFSTIETQKRYTGIAKREEYQQLLADRVSDAVAKVTGIDAYMSDHIKEMSKEVVDTTLKHIDHIDSDSVVNIDADASADDGQEHGYGHGHGYWLSFDRAEDIAKSEANTFLNYTDFVNAKDEGATQKVWLTMLDDRVRDTHLALQGQAIDIDAFFTVGNSLMRFPHDLSQSPEPQEVIGCRCAVQYI